MESEWRIENGKYRKKLGNYECIVESLYGNVAKISIWFKDTYFTRSEEINSSSITKTLDHAEAYFLNYVYGEGYENSSLDVGEVEEEEEEEMVEIKHIVTELVPVGKVTEFGAARTKALSAIEKMMELIENK